MLEQFTSILDSKTPINRRDFLRGVGFVTGSALLAACSGNNSQKTEKVTHFQGCHTVTDQDLQRKLYKATYQQPIKEAEIIQAENEGFYTECSPCKVNGVEKQNMHDVPALFPGDTLCVTVYKREP